MEVKNNQKGLHMLAKPTGPICNLDCHYCFYTEKEALFSKGATYRMSDDVLETFIRSYIKNQDTPIVSFVWQGGEPTLAGLDFYKKVVKLQRKYAGKKKIENALQTNGTLLTEAWCQFLKKHKFIVGLSLDGPEWIHDHYRVDRGKKPTFYKVMRALSLLQTYNVDYNVLACVTRESSKHPSEIYRFFKEYGVRFIQFIPIVEREPDHLAEYLGLRHSTPPSLLEKENVHRAVTPWTVESEAYGDFLIAIFEEWVRTDVGSIHVMNFEWALTNWLGLDSTICLFAETCGRAVIMEHNGDIYSCDHYVYPEYKIGSILNNSLDDVIDSEIQIDFGASKKTSLPPECINCEVLFACNGECPKHRFEMASDDTPRLNYLCQGYKKYFRHIHRYMKVMVQLIENGLPVSEVMNVIKGPLIVKN